MLQVKLVNVNTLADVLGEKAGFIEDCRERGTDFQEVFLVAICASHGGWMKCNPSCPPDSLHAISR
jgi:hypothetical protein